MNPLDQPIMDTVRDHFRQLLMPRNKGLIGVIEADKRFFVTLGYHPPFMEVDFTDIAIVMWVVIPEQFKRFQNRNGTNPQFGYLPADSLTIKTFSKTEKLRRREVESILLNRRPRQLKEGEEIVFDVFLPDSLTKSEFYINTIITKVKYLVTNSGWNGIRPKNAVDDLTSLLDFATREYNKKILKPKRKRK